MPRLFTALWPPLAAIVALRTELAADGEWPPDGWRAVPPVRWHLTLGFHGEGDGGVLARDLDRLAADIRAPWLRLAGTVVLPRVAAAAVVTAGRSDADALAALVLAGGGDPRRHRAHVTVARTSRRGDAPTPGGPPARHRGPWWRPEEVCLVRSELTSGSPRYTVLHRVSLLAEPARRPVSG